MRLFVIVWMVFQLPGDILVGEGKPNNQNHALIFTRGEAVQAIDMNQDATLEDAIKIRQVKRVVITSTPLFFGTAHKFGRVP